MKEFNRHPMENNKNTASLNEIETRYRTVKPRYRNDQRARKHCEPKETHLNEAIAFFYHTLVAKCKEMFSTLPNKEDRVMLMLDLTKDPVNSSGIHCIATSTFFIHLECDAYHKYRVEYQFYRCPFEKQIQEQINRLTLRSFSTQIATQADYPAFFRRVLACQPERFIHLL